MRNILKILFVIFLLFLSIFLLCRRVDAQTTYYVKNSGSDAANGLSDATAWETITKVNSIQSSLTAGDSILFKRGDTFFGGINIGKSGISGNLITYADYGEGEKPIITGLQAVTGWTSRGDTVYYKVIAAQAIPTYILINGQWQRMGRYPNNNYLYYESFSTNVSITDNHLTGTPNWTGAEVVIRKNDWVLDRNLITNHSNSTISYTPVEGGSGYAGLVNYGYFIQSDYRTLDQLGEWYYKADTLFVYFGANNPDDYVVEIPAIKNLVYNYIPGSNSYDFLKFENISFRGSGASALFFRQWVDYVTIQNCDITYSGLHGIEGFATARYFSVDGNNINYTVGSGVFFDTSPGHAITNNVIRNTGMLMGAAPRTDRVHGVYGNYCDNMLVQYNRIDTVSYCGISVRGTNSLVKNNFITNFVMLYADGGGIYTSSASSGGTNSAYPNRQIIGNIIGVGHGSGDGTPTPTKTWVRGIYLDTGAGDVTVTDNTSYDSDFGFFQGGGQWNKYYRNTAFDNKIGAIFIQQYYDLSPVGTYPRITDTEMKHNIFVAKTFTERTMQYYIADAWVAPAFSVLDSNYYMRPISDGGNTFYSWVRKDTDFTTWQTLTGQDANSKTWTGGSLASDTLIKLYINPTKNDSTFSVTDMLDIDRNKFSGDTTLSAYGSMILLHDPDPTPLVTTLSVYRKSSTTVEAAGIVTDDGGGTISARGFVYSYETIPTIADGLVNAGDGLGEFSAIITGLFKNKLYYMRSFVTNEFKTAYGELINIYTDYSVFKIGEKYIFKDVKIIIN